jgi:endogenous inhibitor of DNA gyrase (YacG/DUF329 family)
MGRPKGSKDGVRQTIAVKCALCGNDKQIKPFEFRNSKTKRFFCNRKCMGKWQSVHFLGDSNPNFSVGKIQCNCVICGKPKLISPSRKKHHPITVCSDKCKGIYNASRYKGDKSPKWKPGKETTCAYCGKTVLKTIASQKAYKNNFCSSKCHSNWRSEHNKQSNNPNWNGGKSFDPYPIAFTEDLKETVRDRDQRVCQLCGKTESQNGEKLSVHHIDYDKENLNLENLISLCHDCHVKTNFKRQYWTELLRQKNAV